MIRSNHKKMVFVLFFCFTVLVFGQEKNSAVDKQLREEVLAAYRSGGEPGLLDFVKKNKDKISNKFIVDFAEAGFKTIKVEWVKACEVMAVERRDEKTMADVLFYTGKCFRRIPDFKKAIDYFDQALFIYQKINDQSGQGNIHLMKGMISFLTGDNSRALERYDKALPFFEKAGNPLGQGNVYWLKGKLYSRISEHTRALEQYDKALLFYEKTGLNIVLGNIYTAKGEIYLRISEHTRALEQYDRALTFFEKAGNFLGFGDVYLNKGVIYSQMGDHSKALKMFEKALPFFKKAGAPIGQGNVYQKTADIYSYSCDYATAFELYDKALPLYEKAGDLLGQGNTYMRKGMIYFGTGENQRALEQYDKAMHFYEKAGSPPGRGNIYMNRGRVYSSTCDYSRAIEMYNKALPIFEKAGAPMNLGNIYKQKGRIYYFTGDNFRALEMYDKALIFYEKAGDPLGQGNVYCEKGHICSVVGDNSKVPEMYDKALFFFEKAGEPLGQGSIYRYKGDICAKAGDHSRAIKMYNKALTFYDNVKAPRARGAVFLEKGNVYSSTGDNLKAVEMYDKAFSLFEKAGDIKHMSFVMHSKAQVLVKMGEKEKALTLFVRGIANQENIRRQTTFSEMKQTLMESVYKQYEEALLFMLENKYHEKSFKYAESMRTRVFLDRMAEGLVRLDKGLAPQLKEKRDILVAKLSLLSKEMHETVEEKEKKKLQALKDRYYKVESELEDLLVKIRLNNPLYAQVRYPRPISVQALQKEVLKKNEMLIRYFISPGKTYAFLVSRGTFKVVAIDIEEKEIDNTVGVYLRALKEKNAEHIRRYGNTLYRELFKPLEPEIKKRKDITIIPDGQLATIPFESLIIEKKASGRPVFLLEKYRIKYIQSASLFSVLRKHYRRDSTRKNFIGFGDPVYNYENFKKGKPVQTALTGSPQTGDEIKQLLRSRYARSGGAFDRLPASGKEVHAIARLFEKHAQKAVVFSREQANEKNAKAPGMKDYDYIHFACHGLLNDDFQSLVLSQLPEKQSTEDGYFTLNEIMNCDYRAKLIVLSACQTGSGKMERAEGVTGLTRAVMYAGTPAVVASLWNVDDQAAKELMLHFYRNLLEKNMNKAEALRQAKLSMLKTERRGSPLYWSAFVMYGE